MPQKYSEQYCRMMRWYDHIKKYGFINFYKLDESLCRQDDYLAFFMNCYYLKDWIINDPLVKSKKIVVENFIANSPLLRTCQELCNGFKHLNQKKQKNIKMQVIAHISGFNPITFDSGYKINVNDKNYDVLDFAARCVDEWETFLKNNKLSIPAKQDCLAYLSDGSIEFEEERDNF